MNVPDGKSADPKWFQKRLLEMEMSQSELGRSMGLDKSAISRLINGDRKASAEEASVLSSILGVPLSEVLLRLGAPVPKPRKTVRIVGFVNDSGAVRWRKDGAIAAPDNVTDNTVAVQFDDAISLWYGWAYYFEPTTDVPAAAIGKLCVVTLKTGGVFIRFVRHGLVTERYDLITLAGDVTRNAELASAAPVIWTRS